MALGLAAVFSLLLVVLSVLAPVDVEGISVNVTFTLKKKVDYGRGIVVTGDVAILGNWDPVSGVQLKVDTSTGVDWSASTVLDLDVGKAVEYKPVITDYGTGQNPVWYPGYNLVFVIPEKDTLSVPINWPDLAPFQGVQVE